MIMVTELLAPARDYSCGVAAIDAGADAVYIGAPSFGARAKAGNALEDIARLVHYAHLYWARVYVTVNTLLYDAEIPQAVELIEALHALGVDGAIIQDVGLLECDLPPIPLIASTQMHNFTPARVKFLEQIGFHRAILARELTLSEIQAIRSATTTIELESFVHGALCVSYSGQCAMSYAVGGRSGNRGECAQPCRRRYDLVDGQGHVLQHSRHLLSLRDMNRITDLGALLDAGVSSFKIEGRLKDVPYVTTVVSAYRQALDDALAERAIPERSQSPSGPKRSSSGQSRFIPVPDLGKAFNRGFTPYFLRGRGVSPGATRTPKMVGEYLGSVVALSPRSFVVESDAEASNGDGLAFFGPSDELTGTVVNGSRRTHRGLEITPNSTNGVVVGQSIYRNHDRAYETSIAASPPVRTLSVRFVLGETEKGLRLHVEDEDGTVAYVDSDGVLTPAQKPDQAEATARRQLARTGGTQYRCTEVELMWSQPIFVPVSKLNDLRRAALAELTRVREANRPVRSGRILRNEVPYPEPVLDYRGNALNSRAVAFYRRHGVVQIEPAAESGLDLRGRPVMSTRYCIKDELGWCPHLEGAPRLSEPLYLVDEAGHRYQLHFRCSDYPERCGMDISY